MKILEFLVSKQNEKSWGEFFSPPSQLDKITHFLESYQKIEFTEQTTSLKSK